MPTTEKPVRLRTRIMDVPVCNDHITKQTAYICKIKEKEVREIIEFVVGYTGSIITGGTMETVRLPYFGKFVPIKQMVKAVQKKERHKNNGMDPAVKALIGRPIKIKTDETI